MARKAPSTAAAPPMSPFMPTIPSEGLKDRPPESKVIPLPTSATVPRGLLGRVLEAKEPRHLLGPTVHPEQPAELLLPDLLLVPHGDLEAG